MTATFRKRNQVLQEHVISTLRAERPMTLRALYYRLASAGHIDATDAGYNQLKRLTKKLRESGAVPITGWIVDRVRSTLKPSSWSGLADFGDTVRQAYRKDLWAQMPHHVEVSVGDGVIRTRTDNTAHEVSPLCKEVVSGLRRDRTKVSPRRNDGPCSPHTRRASGPARRGWPARRRRALRAPASRCRAERRAAG